MRAAAALALVGALIAGCRGRNPTQLGPAEDEIWIAPDTLAKGEARVAAAQTQSLADPVVVGGRIAFDDLRIGHVVSPVTGRVTRVIAPLGARVGKGSPLATIVSPEVGTASSDDVKARADLVAAQREFERQQKLWAGQAGSQRDFEAAENAYRKADAEAQRAAQKVRLLSAGEIDAVTQAYQLPSPIDGRVVARMVNPGTEVQGQYSGGTASELFTIGDTNTVWLYADVPEAELDQVRVGTPLRLRVLAYPEQVFAGTVDWVSPTLDPALRTTRIRASLANPDGHLKPEMYATVYLQRSGAPQLAVPREAIVRITDEAFVYVADGSRPDGTQVFKRRHVQLADGAVSVPPGVPAVGTEADVYAFRGPDVVAVRDGLSEGERVLITSRRPHRSGADEVPLTTAQVVSGKIETVAVTARDAPDAITVGGRLTFDDLRVAHVFSPVTGRVTRILAAPGDHVQKDTPLAVIVSPDVGSAFADELEAKADLETADKERTRQREMYALSATARHDVEVAEDRYDVARAEYDRAVQKTRLLREGALDALTQEYVLRSPIDGEVVARMVNPGMEVQGQYSNAGNVAELFTIGDLDEVWLLGDVYEVDLPEVGLGADVAVQVPAYPGRTFRGRVDWVSDVLDPVRRTAGARVVLHNEQGLLRPEMYAVAHIATPVRQTVMVPREALMRLGDETIVFVEGPPDRHGRVVFQRRRVMASEQRARGDVSVFAGLQAGERVATRGAILLLGML